MPHNRMLFESAELYDSLYSFKNYSRDCDRLRSLISKYVPGARTFLDVAFSTGEHARFSQTRLMREHKKVWGGP